MNFRRPTRRSHCVWVTAETFPPPPQPQPPPNMPRNMTNPEKQRFLGYFPPMDVDNQPRVTGEATPLGTLPRYNCIAWSVGITNRWINPLQDLHRWDLFYAIFHLERDDDQGTVALWRRLGRYTHACRATAQHGFNWESKCGSDLRVLHELDEMTGSSYGAVFTYYRPEVVAAAPAPVTFAPSPLTAAPAVIPQEHIAALQKLTDKVPAPVNETFESLFAAWKATWFTGPTAESSDTRDCASGYAFEKLLEMGPEILPLVAAKIADPDNFVAMQLYDDLQPDKEARIVHEPGDPAIATGEQGRAQQTVAAYLRGKA